MSTSQGEVHARLLKADVDTLTNTIPSREASSTPGQAMQQQSSSESEQAIRTQQMRHIETQRMSLRALYDRATNAAEALPVDPTEERLKEALEERRKEALEDLDLALGMRSLREDAANDPSFLKLRADETFIRLIWQGKGLSDLRAIGDHGKALAAMGIRSPDQLIGHTNTAETKAALAKALGVPEKTVDWWRNLCQLASKCEPEPLALPWVDLLADEGIDSIEQLKTKMEDENDAVNLYRRLAARAEERGVIQPSLKDLRYWASRAEIPLKPTSTKGWFRNIMAGLR